MSLLSKIKKLEIKNLYLCRKHKFGCIAQSLSIHGMILLSHLAALSISGRMIWSSNPWTILHYIGQTLCTPVKAERTGRRSAVAHHSGEDRVGSLSAARITTSSWRTLFKGKVEISLTKYHLQYLGHHPVLLGTWRNRKVGFTLREKAISEDWPQDVLHVAMSRFKSFQRTIITIFKDVNKDVFRVIEQRDTISREMEILIKNQMGIPELKNPLVGLKSILKTTAGRISKLTTD